MDENLITDAQLYITETGSESSNSDLIQQKVSEFFKIPMKNILSEKKSKEGGDRSEIELTIYLTFEKIIESYYLYEKLEEFSDSICNLSERYVRNFLIHSCFIEPCKKMFTLTHNHFKEPYLRKRLQKYNIKYDNYFDFDFRTDYFFRRVKLCVPTDKTIFSKEQRSEINKYLKKMTGEYCSQISNLNIGNVKIVFCQYEPISEEIKNWIRIGIDRFFDKENKKKQYATVVFV
jgi:hypothetical protein